MDIRKLQRAIVDGLEDVKGQNIAVFNTEHLTAMFERVIIASGTSNRQTKALAASVRDAVKSQGMEVLRTEGEDNGEWIIVDCGAAVAHIMQPAIRDYYHLEEIWGGKVVRLKLASTETRLVKASEPEPAPRASARKGGVSQSPAARQPAAKAPARKMPARKTVAAKAPARKTVATKAPARKAVAVKTPAIKSTSAKVKTVVVQRPARKNAAVKKAPARKTAR
ncbi:MAG: ribosome silencing factor [Rubrivivax sp.]|nr:ribosome silencing factor [Rubrivivax sp.]